MKRSKGEEVMIIAMYVNNFFSAGNNKDVIKWVKAQLCKMIVITDLGEQNVNNDQNW